MTVIELSQVLGNFGEFFGAIAVVGTLIFLAIQVRHSREATEANTQSLEEARKLAAAQTYQDRAFRRLEMMTAIVHSDHHPAMLVKLGALDGGISLEKLSELTDEERIRSYWQHVCFTIETDNAFFQHRQGYLSDQAYQVTERQILNNVAWWRRLGLIDQLDSEFRTEVERLETDSQLTG